jgi:hypothetical protein
MLGGGLLKVESIPGASKGTLSCDYSQGDGSQGLGDGSEGCCWLLYGTQSPL